MQDFFSYQEQARRNTTILVVLLLTAITLIILAIYAAVTLGLFFGQLFLNQLMINSFWDESRFIWTVAITLAVVCGGSLYRSNQLRQGGGAAVAEMMGAERVPAATDDPLLRRLLNVVEEMAIASGVPVPPVYLMQQSGINAFAAGFSSSDAVIAVTRGATELLSRDELQGVMAHEFSHILNGDTLLKMRLMGLLYGITLIADAGILMITARNSVAYSRSERSSHPALMVIGFMIFMVGVIGAVFADMIKRAVSRQREFLADAAAVQFTRNPSGLAGALKTIGGYKGGSRINHAASQQTSHFFFGNAVKSWENKDWWATHPPLVERIRRLEPRFSGDFKPLNSASRSTSVMHEAVSAFAGAEEMIPAGLNASVVDTVMDSVGHPGANELRQARTLLARIPQRLADFAHDPFTARATMYALLLDSSAKIRMVQLEQLQKEADANVFREMLEIQPVVAQLEVELKLPLIEMLLPALKELSKTQFDTFRSCIRILTRADEQIGLFEYMMQRMLLRHLYPAFLKTRPMAVYFDAAGEIVDEAAVIIAMLIGKGSHARPATVFEAAMEIFSDGDLPAMPELGGDLLSVLDDALRKAERASPPIKRRLLKACVFTVLADGKTTVPEIELLRIIADALGVPMPQIRLKTP
jgi:Zn-dependent protease with chaperone function